MENEDVNCLKTNRLFDLKYLTMEEAMMVVSNNKLMKEYMETIKFCDNIHDLCNNDIFDDQDCDNDVIMNENEENNMMYFNDSEREESEAKIIMNKSSFSFDFMNQMSRSGSSAPIGMMNMDFNEMVDLEERDIVTSLDVEKNRHLLSLVTIPGPSWIVGLIVNIAGRYDKNGEKLIIKKKVRHLTIIFLTNKTINEIQKHFNIKSSSPCNSNQNYCGFLPVVSYISGFKTEESAKTAFSVWKHRTRNPFSRFQCGIVVFDTLKKKHQELKFYQIQKNPKEMIKFMTNYKK